MTPIETLIVRAYVQSISRVVAESYLTYGASNTNDGLQISSSGIYSGTVPRKFNLEATGYGTMLVTEMADVNKNPDAPYSVAVVSGVPFVITGTGISVTATFDSDGVLMIGDKFQLRVGKCSTTIREVIPWEKSRAALAHPGAIIYVPSTEKSLERVQGYMCTMDMVIEFLTDLRSNDSEGLAEDIGCIENELNRDLTQGDVCWKSEINKVQKFDTDGVDVVGAQIFCTAYYRHTTADVSERF